MGRPKKSAQASRTNGAKAKNKGLAVNYYSTRAQPGDTHSYMGQTYTNGRATALLCRCVRTRPLYPGVAASSVALAARALSARRASPVTTAAEMRCVQ